MIVNPGWDFCRSFYFATQAGLSVGFGQLNEEKQRGSDLVFYEGAGDEQDVNFVDKEFKKLYQEKYKQGVEDHNVQDGRFYSLYWETNPFQIWSKFYTIIHVCIGAQAISAVLGLFAANAISASEEWYKDTEDNQMSK